MAVRPLDRVNDLALRLWKLGEHPDALAAAQTGRDLAPAGQADKATEAGVRASPTRLLTLLRERWEVRAWRNQVRIRRNNAERVRLLAARDPEAQGSLAQARQSLAAALGGQSDALDTLAFRSTGLGRCKDARAAARRALKAQEEATDIYRKIYRTLLPSERSRLAKPFANSLNTLALRLRSAARPEEAEVAAEEASKIRQEGHVPSRSLAEPAGSVRSHEAAETPRTG